MRLRQLEYFIAVAETGSFTQAAADLFVAQPSLSQQILALEKEVGGALFERVPRGVQLTAAGRAFLEEAKNATQAAQRACEAVQAVARGQLGEIRLATLTSLAVGLAPSLISSWARQHPAVAIRLSEYSHPDRLEDVVRVAEADMGIGPLPHGGMEEVFPLGAEEFVFVVNENDPIARYEKVDPSDVADRPWVLFQESHGLAAMVRRMCSLWGFTPIACVRTSQTEAAIRLAAAGVGPTVVPSNVISSSMTGIAVRPVCRPVVRRLSLYCRGPLRPLDAAFLETVRQNPDVKVMAELWKNPDIAVLA